MRRLLISTLALAMIVGALSACAHPTAVSRENDRLRFEVLDLQNQVESLTQRNKELEQELQQSATAPTSLPDDVRANIPHVTKIDMEKLSFARDTDNDNRPDVLTIYLSPSDSRGRFVQLVGTVSATALLIPMNAEPLTIGQMTLTPARVRDAYRSSFTGTHYTIELPIELPESWNANGALKDAFVRMVYTDGVTGQTQTSERMISLKPD